MDDVPVSELERFALACAAAFWVFDECPALIALIRTPGDPAIRAVITWIGGSAFDVALAAAIVYVTVPRMARYFVRQMSPAGPRE